MLCETDDLVSHVLRVSCCIAIFKFPIIAQIDVLVDVLSAASSLACAGVALFILGGAAMGRSGVAAAGCGATRRGAPTWTTQLQALTWKNYALSIRLCRTTACEFLAPICCMLLLGILDHQVRYGRPEVTPGAFASFKRNEGPLPCLVFDDQSGIYGYGLPITGAWCVPVLFAPTTAPDVMQIMGRAASLNGYAAPANFSGDASIPGGPVACGGESRTATRQCMLGFSSVSAMKVWLKANPGRAAVGIVFGDTSRLVAGDGTSYTASVVTDSLPPTDVSYEIWYNESAVKVRVCVPCAFAHACTKCYLNCQLSGQVARTMSSNSTKSKTRTNVQS